MTWNESASKHRNLVFGPESNELSEHLREDAQVAADLLEESGFAEVAAFLRGAATQRQDGFSWDYVPEKYENAAFTVENPRNLIDGVKLPATAATDYSLTFLCNTRHSRGENVGATIGDMYFIGVVENDAEPGEYVRVSCSQASRLT